MNTSRRTLLLGSAASVAGAVLQSGLAGRPRAAAAAPRTTVYRGVNLSGAEFTADAAHLPGLVDRDYRYPTRDDLRYIARRGHTMVRLPVRWERLQPSLLGPLDAAESRRLTATVDAAAAAGLKVLVDLHNYARYVRPAREGGATLVLGDGQLDDAHLVDLWARSSTVLKGRPGVLGYGLMNEPHDLPAEPARPGPGTIAWSFDEGAGSWSGEEGTAVSGSTTAGTYREGRASLRLSRSLVAGQQYLRANDGAQGSLDPADGRTLTAWVLVPADAAGTGWMAHLEMQDAAYRWRPGPNVPLTPGRWTSISCTPDDATWDHHRGVGIQLSCDVGSSAAVEVYVDAVGQQQAGSAALTEAQRWERTTQRCVDAIRGQGDWTPVYVPGVAYSGAQHWAANHPEPWIEARRGAVVYEAHYYPDRDNVGTFQRGYVEEDADARRQGYASLQDRATTELGRFLGWCGTHAVRGFVGEIGWDGQRDAARWNGVGAALYAALDRAGVGASYWAAGQWYGTGYALSAYTGSPLSRGAAPAAVIERYPSRNT